MYFKKSYAEQLFQIALALSLFQVDYHSIGRNFDFEFQNYGNRNNWEELQMLHAVPTTSFQYANRKAMIPLIEDLIRFDRTSVDLINHNVTAYLLVNGSTNQTSNTPEPEGAVAIETLQNFNTTSFSVDLDLDLYDEFGTSIFEQNLSDLRDFGEIPILSPTTMTTYNGLPLKDEPVDYYYVDKVEEGGSAPVAGSSNSDSGGEGGNPNSNGNSTILARSCCEAYNATKTNDSVKVENEEHEETTVAIKQEPTDDSEEEIEAVEVLWKQDVDLGYCLPTASDEIVKEGNQTETSEEDIEKLKALEELKNDKSKDGGKDADPVDEWSGIHFTIDNETGEYIRLPSPSQFDELLENLGDLGDIQVDDLKEEEAPVPNPIIEKKEETTSEPSTKDKEENREEKEKACDISPLPSPLFNLDEAVNDLDELDMMIQSHHHKNNPQSYGASNSAFRQSGFHQPRGPLSRGVSMEQRLQDIANFFNPIPGMGMGVGEMPPYSHYPTHYPYQSPHQHSQFTHPAYSGLGDLNATQPHYGHNLGSAVTSSMHLTNSSHDSADNNSTSGYKVDHDMMYYSNTSSEMNHTAEGFINSILNDEDLHLMDMNVPDNFCNLRMIDNPASNTSSLLGCGATGGSTASGGSSASQHHGGIGGMIPSNLHGNGSLNITNDGLVAGATGLAAHGGGDRLDASSDSAVSSMGSERVPSLSDGEWGEGSDSAQDFHHGKYGGPYDYSYNNRMADNQSRPTAQPPVAQKKHQMYGKRFFSEQPPVQHSGGNTPVKYEYDSYNTSRLDGGAAGISATADIKYSSYADFNNRIDQQPPSIIQHNHTYSLPQGSGINPRPQQRDKKAKNKSNSESSSNLDMSEHLSRDEKRARSLNIPISVQDIINLPMDEFNERLSKYDLTENQLSLIRDIRRRGKNKVAAQNCRKRKLDQIVNLEDEVKEVRQRKGHLYSERDNLLKEKKRVTAKFQMLHSHIFQYLRDSDGNPCSPNDYTLQQAADGSVYLLRKDSMKLDGGNMQNHHHHHNNKHKE